ncbi:hypothetical protein SLS63_002704 [Diaporthe eres]|uniref:Atos-like C-terminal domain-containing protein n=1 Tax=Diaporthe eres TaxID=83184 RepID=A0ABR1PIW9_DIAER
MSLRRQLSEESIRTELCEGPVPDTSGPSSPTPGLSVNTTSDRIELIERLKRGESPTWSPKRHLESLFRRSASREQPTSPQPTPSESATLSPPTKDRLGSQTQEAEDLERVQQGLAIERPRSALHSGDFTQHASSSRNNEVGKEGVRIVPNSEGFYREHHSRFATSPPRDFTPFKFERRIPFADPPDGFRASPPSVSSSISSSFVYKHPTSPLVQSESNDDLNLYVNTPHGRSKSDDGPSPYVGHIDLENGLSNPEETSRQRRKSHQRSISAATKQRLDGDEDIVMTDINSGGDVANLDARKATKLKRRSASPKAPPGGSYRIPEKGQVQIIIKNQNKTAVKLFLVPYDLEGMEPGTKTFIRQRCYSAGGPIVENLPSTNDRPTLRYLVHLHICCPAKGRFYLYKSIRVVFANRVPDGKEKLRNEITLPEPKFTPYKPVRVMHQPVMQTTGPGASLAAEKAFRRRSSGFSFGQQLPPFDPNEPMPSLSLLRARASSFQDRGLSLGRPIGTGLSGGQVLAPTSVPADAPPTMTPLSFAKGDIGGYVGGGSHYPGSSSGAAIAEGLLSQRLRSLGMQNACRGESENSSDLKEC